MYHALCTLCGVHTPSVKFQQISGIQNCHLGKQFSKSSCPRLVATVKLSIPYHICNLCFQYATLQHLATQCQTSTFDSQNFLQIPLGACLHRLILHMNMPPQTPQIAHASHELSVLHTLCSCFFSNLSHPQHNPRFTLETIKAITSILSVSDQTSIYLY